MALNTRQRIVLHLLNHNQRSTGRTELMKWLFLYSQTSASAVSRYDFVPHRFGPFSFEVYQDLQYSLGQFTEGWDSHDKQDKTLRLLPDSLRRVKSNVARIPEGDRQTASAVWEEYHNLNRTRLLEIVYERYPWYASRSTLIQTPPLHQAPLAIYTIGYEGRSVDAFFNCILQNGVQGILDVRRNAFSQKFGFTAGVLKDVCKRLDIRYSHLPELGIASEMRKDLTLPGVLERLFHDYELELEYRNTELEQAVSIVSSRPTTLLCFEAEPHRCHRGRLAPILASLTGYDIQHL